ncbi:zf-HC2 domain-containing protein [Salirhabdus salicampi]|uniref:zf-HC2 domain-containing protein n=1 Tax=Salirhabdus salicampi TaxID=476102 RepID=UPI0020C4A41C|nr:zf-HC2 domain-containing protein [Salirhabdus salicampi]MCP8617276.1 zf-HC2 domain-containing protein [Salirhabdus salicampi]
MNLTCEAVQDMYVLYEEDDLHRSTKKAIDEHLSTCTQCTKVYKSGENFITAKQGEETITPPDKLDKQIKLKLKLRKIQFAFLFFVAVILVYSFFQYVDNRKNLLYEVSRTEQTLMDLNFELDQVKTEGDVRLQTSLIEDMNEKTSRIPRYLNIYENYQLDQHPYQFNLSVNYHLFLEALHERYKHGYWTYKDEEALNRMKGYFDEYTRLLTDERLKLNDARNYHPSSLFTPFKGKKIKSIHQKIDYLAYSYSNFLKFPEEVDIMTKAELKKHVRKMFQMPEAEVSVTPDVKEEIVRGYGLYNTSLASEDYYVYASWDAYTGRLIEVQNHRISERGELLKENLIREKANQYINQLLGVQEFRLDYLGVNYHYQSNMDTKVYTYHVKPTNDGFETNSEYRLRIDARTGNIASLMSTDNPFYNHFTFATSDVKFTNSDGLKSLEEKYPEVQFQYKDTIYIPSLLNNEYVLVHQYEGEHEEGYTVKVLLNVNTGEEEVMY